MAKMHDEQKTQEELIAELQRLRHRVAELQESENQRKQAEEAMRQAEQRYRAVAESAVTGIGIVDPEETLTFVNSAFAEMLGYAQEELTGMSLSQLADPEEFAGYQERTKERAKKGVHSHYETTLRRKDGSVLNILVSASPLTASDGSFEGTLAVIVDITERKTTRGI
jgi:PAS domain S-box-containing protein